jgi:hypothetical protein
MHHSVRHEAHVGLLREKGSRLQVKHTQEERRFYMRHWMPDERNGSALAVVSCLGQ